MEKQNTGKSSDFFSGTLSKLSATFPKTWQEWMGTTFWRVRNRKTRIANRCLSQRSKSTGPCSSLILHTHNSKKTCMTTRNVVIKFWITVLRCLSTMQEKQIKNSPQRVHKESTKSSQKVHKKFTKSPQKSTFVHKKSTKSTQSATVHKKSTKSSQTEDGMDRAARCCGPKWSNTMMK